jgi:DNA repair protein RecO (recombination protein O)
MAGHLDLLCRSQLQVALGRNLDIVTQAEGRENFLHLRNDLWHMTCGFYLAELVDRFVEDRTQHRDIYALLLDTLRYLDADAMALQQQRQKHDNNGNNGSAPASSLQEEGKTRLLLRYFELHLLTAIGYEPALQNCAHCAAEILPQDNGFRASLGGILCPQCSRYWERRLSLDALKVLRYMQRRTWKEVSRLQPNARLHAELEAVMHDLLRYHLERDLKSWSFLEMLRKD